MTVSTRLATNEDLHAIVDLLRPNTAVEGGSLYGDWSENPIREWLASGTPVVLAIEAGNVTGVLFSAEKAAATAPPVIATLKAYPGEEDAYVYGPVCIDASMRGKGVLGLLYAEMKKHMKARQGILFINKRNEASLRAHHKMRMRTVAEFKLGSEDFDVLTTDGADA